MGCQSYTRSPTKIRIQESTFGEKTKSFSIHFGEERSSIKRSFSCKQLRSKCSECGYKKTRRCTRRQKLCYQRSSIRVGSRVQGSQRRSTNLRKSIIQFWCSSRRTRFQTFGKCRRWTTTRTRTRGFGSSTDVIYCTIIFQTVECLINTYRKINNNLFKKK